MTTSSVKWLRWESGMPAAPELCQRCTPPHVVNCPQCNGYGVHTLGDSRSAAAIEASEIAAAPERWQPCPSCGGTPSGAPGAASGANT